MPQSTQHPIINYAAFADEKTGWGHPLTCPSSVATSGGSGNQTQDY